MDSIKRKLIDTMLPPAVTVVIGQIFTKENFQLYGDRLFDFLEDFVKDTRTTIDDRIVLPVIAELREFMDIPDDISEESG